MKTSLLVSIAAAMLGSVGMLKADIADISAIDWGFDVVDEETGALQGWTMTGWNRSQGAKEVVGNSFTNGISVDTSDTSMAVYFDEGMGAFDQEDPLTYGYMALTSKAFTVDRDVSYKFALNMEWDSFTSESDHLYILVHGIVANMDDLYDDAMPGSGAEIWTNHVSAGYPLSSAGVYSDSSFTSRYNFDDSGVYALTILLAYDGYKFLGENKPQEYSSFAFDFVKYEEVTTPTTVVPAPASVALAFLGSALASVVRRYR